MVADDASPQADPYSSGSFADQDGDFANTDSLGSRYPDLSQYDRIYKPDLLTMYLGFFGKRNWERQLARRLKNQAEMAQFIVQRRPTQSEMEAFATIGSRGLYHSTIGLPLGFAVGMGSFYRSFAKTGYVPFGIRSSPKAFFEAAKLFWITEPANARLFFVVSAFKVALWTVGVSVFTNTWATYEDAKGTMTDPRLSNFLAELKRQNPEDVRKRKLAALQDRYRQAQQSRTQQPLPGGGAYAESHEHDDGGFGGSNEDAFDASPLSRQNQTPEKPRSVPDFSGQSRESPTGKETGLDFFEDDDASPTAPEYRKGKGSSWARLNPSTSQGSAWDRIRQQNAPPQGGGGGGGAGGGDSQDWPAANSYTYEKQRDREQAQANFEKLLDSERNVSDDVGNKGWR